MTSRSMVRLSVALVTGVLTLAMLTLSGFAQPQAEADTVLGTNVYRIPTTEKVCVLTFDDWYNATYLDRMLATLTATGTDATFFPPGACVDANRWLTLRIEEAGFDIASHSYSHAWMTRLSTSGMISQLQRTERALALLGIKDPAPLFRAPYGAWNSTLLSILRREGYINVMWSATAGDTYPGRTASQVVSMVLAQLKPGAIILMHSSQKTTPDALPELIRQIKARGYRIVNLRDALFPGEQGAARYQQICPQFYYMGSWSESFTQSASGGSLHFGTTANSAVLASFTGTTFELLASTGPGYGKAQVTLDAGTPEETTNLVDLYSHSTWHRASVLKLTGLTDTTHSVLIAHSGFKNDASYGYRINLDAMKVSGELTQAPQPDRVQQDEPGLFAYAGPWSAAANASASGGSVAVTDLPGSAVQVAFNGTYMAWIAKKGPGYGQARVVLDSGTPSETTTIVDLYSSYDAYKQRVYNTGLLADGPHTLSIHWLASKHPRSYGYRLSVDAFDFFGAPTPAPEPAPVLWRYQENDPRLSYLGDWGSTSTWSASGGKFRSVSRPGSAVLCHFDGTSVKLLFRTAPWYGKARITLDGDTASAETIDLYSGAIAYKRALYEKTGLSDGGHTLLLECLEEKNDLSSGYGISLDALDIYGFMNATPQVARHQEDDPLLAYTGTWTSATTWSASGGTYRTSDESGAQVKVEFTGRYFAWITKVAPWYGQAKVTLDPGTPGEVVTYVDLYRGSTAFKKRVYQTGFIADGAHTIIIEWTGDKNTKSSGTTISMDAVDILSLP